MKTSIFFLLLLCFFSCTSSWYHGVYHSYSVESDCKARCLIPDLYEYVYGDTIYKYTGTELDADYVRFEKDVLIEYGQDAQSKWVRKKSNKNCHSSDPKDYYVWCLEETPQTYDIIADLYIVTDTFHTDQWITIRPFKKTLVKQGGYTEIRSIVCHSDVTPILITQIGQALYNKGYLTEPYQTHNTEMKSALSKFQKYEGLPVGHFDCETMEALSINVKCDYE